MVVKKGDQIKVEYTGKLADGTVFDSSQQHGQPLEFEVGSGQIIKGFDDAVMGMKEGQEKEVTIAPVDGYGERRQELLKKIPRTKLPPGEPKVGMMMMLKSPEGQQIPAIITEVTPTEITIDLNHPLAGKTLHFAIKIVGIA